MYKNYNIIAETETGLIESYIENKVEFRLILKHKMDERSLENINGIYWNVEDLIYNYSVQSMKEGTTEISLTGTALSDFTTMLHLAEDLNKYYTDFYEKNYKGLDEEQRRKQIVKNNVWFELLNGIQEVTKKYADYPFVYSDQQQELEKSQITE